LVIKIYPKPINQTEPTKTK